MSEEAAATMEVLADTVSATVETFKSQVEELMTSLEGKRAQDAAALENFRETAAGLAERFARKFESAMTASKEKRDKHIETLVGDLQKKLGRLGQLEHTLNLFRTQLQPLTTSSASEKLQETLSQRQGETVTTPVLPPTVSTE